MWTRPIQEHNCRKKTWKIRLFLDRIWDVWETWTFLTRWLVLSVLQPYSAHLYNIFSTDDVNFISHSIMIEKKINLSFTFVTCLPPRYSPQTDTNEKSCSFAFGTFRSISQLKIGIRLHNTILQLPFSLSLLFLLGLSHNAFFKKKIKEKRKIQQTTNMRRHKGLAL